MPIIFLQTALSPLEKPIFEPRYLNMEYLFNKVFLFVSFINNFFYEKLPLLFGSTPQAFDFKPFMIIGWILSFILFLAILYASYKIVDFKWEEQNEFQAIEVKALESLDQAEQNIHWQRILDQLNLPSESDWRLAIIEADNILGEMVTKMGYIGDSIGEKLKSIERSDFTTLSQAWEAHKVRNRIAHDGMLFRISQREAQRIIDLYRQVFEEFHYI